MGKDLKWLAKNVPEWVQSDDIDQFCDAPFTHIRKDYSGYVLGYGSFSEDWSWYTRAQWHQARQDLGLIMSDEEEEGMARPRQEPPKRNLYDEIKEGFDHLNKQPRYLDAKGEDWIDEFARTSTIDEFRGAMRFTIGKYNRRAGKKDKIIKEIEKMEDYCRRWKEYERGLL